MNPEDCPKFHKCNAPACPLDPKRHKAVHLTGEPVCPYLLATGKPGAAERFADDPVYAVCLDRVEEIVNRHPDIARKVAVAARSGFRGDPLRNARQAV